MLKLNVLKLSMIFSSLRFLSYQIFLQNSSSARTFRNDEEVIGAVNELITTREQFCGNGIGIKLRL